MIDEDGFRANVGIVLTNACGDVLWAKRIGQNAWQFPQGGVRSGESPEQALYRELQEEVGLLPEHVRIIGCTSDWLRYRLPNRYVRRHRRPLCIGQKQKWYLLQLQAPETCVRFDSTEQPEFDGWCWVDYWQPVDEVVFFKRDVYRKALGELAPLRTRLSG
ncbi:MAG: RNA pyrophosphohydrolase [Salinisphaera sp.]|nr:RNA pyrophosphohydrolase [Nevskiaceae bacterium]MDN5937582.1 RNA pyrophosphohydrolase [Salinisphaera sp.]